MGFAFSLSGLMNTSAFDCKAAFVWNMNILRIRIEKSTKSKKTKRKIRRKPRNTRGIKARAGKTCFYKAVR